MNKVCAWVLVTSIWGLPLTAPAHATPILRPATRTYLRALGGPFSGTRALGNLEALVLEHATKKGIEKVRPEQARAILLEVLSSDAATTKLRADVDRKAAEHDARSLGWLHNIHVSLSEADRVKEVERERDFIAEGIGNADEPLKRIGASARYGQASPALWLRGVRLAIRDLRKSGGSASIEALRTELQQLAPESVWKAALDRAANGDKSAFLELDRVVREASQPFAPLLVSGSAAAGVRALAPAMGQSSPTFGDLLRRNLRAHALEMPIGNLTRHSYETQIALARAAHAEGRAFEVLELTDGIPLTTLGQMSKGMYLKAASWRESDAVAAVHATIVTPRDALYALSGGAVPPGLHAQLAKELGSTLGLDASRARTPVTLQQVSEKLAAHRAAGSLDVHEGDVVAQLADLARSGKRYDLFIARDARSTPDRVRLIGAMQSVLRPGGRGFVPLDGTALDYVVGADGSRQDLARFLATQRPDAFEFSDYMSQKTLVVKGTTQPVSLPALDAAATGKYEDGKPQLEWKPAEARSVSR